MLSLTALLPIRVTHPGVARQVAGAAVVGIALQGEGAVQACHPTAFHGAAFVIIVIIHRHRAGEHFPLWPEIQRRLQTHSSLGIYEILVKLFYRHSRCFKQREKKC